MLNTNLIGSDVATQIQNRLEDNNNIILIWILDRYLEDTGIIGNKRADKQIKLAILSPAQNTSTQMTDVRYKYIT